MLAKSRKPPFLGSWRTQLVQALNSCEVMVALCSPHYYESASCISECEFLESRGKLNGSRLYMPLIVVNWIPGGKRPQVIEEMQYKTDALPELYYSLGLNSIMEQEWMHDVYVEVRRVLARSIRDACQAGLPSFATGCVPAWHASRMDRAR